MALLRLDKYLADMQIGTRSQVKELIKKGCVLTNGKKAAKPEMKIDTQADEVLVNGEAVGYVAFEYYMLHKPAGVLSAARDKKAQTVLDLIKDRNRKDLFPVGRLDKDTEGLLLITNDGKLAHELLAPKKHVDKTYYARVKGKMGKQEIALFHAGIKINEDFTALPALMDILSYDADADTSEVEVTIHEGKFHQIKKMFEALQSEVLYLKRLRMGPLQLDQSLQPGEYRRLTLQEVEDLHRCSD